MQAGRNGMRNRATAFQLRHMIVLELVLGNIIIIPIVFVLDRVIPIIHWFILPFGQIKVQLI